MRAVWAELNLVVADQFRDGTVPASFAPLPVAHATFAARTSTVQEYYFCGDSACHESALLTWLRNPTRPNGPAGFIGFAISARMSPALAAAIQTLPETAWPPYTAPGKARDDLRNWADVPFVPSEASEQRDTEPLRYVAVRVRPQPGDLFADGSAVTHFAVLSNVWEGDGARLLQWHREKAGTIEHVQDVVKNELAGGVLPCGRFGANAAWLRLACTGPGRLSPMHDNSGCGWRRRRSGSPSGSRPSSFCRLPRKSLLAPSVRRRDGHRAGRRLCREAHRVPDGPLRGLGGPAAPCAGPSRTPACHAGTISGASRSASEANPPTLRPD
jgi:hypothetical protein